MATMANNRQRYIAENMSRGYCLEAAKFRCISFAGLRAVEESLVMGNRMA